MYGPSDLLIFGEHQVYLNSDAHRNLQGVKIRQDYIQQERDDEGGQSDDIKTIQAEIGLLRDG
jgi:hypothetical protein